MTDTTEAGDPWVVREGALSGVRVLDLTRILAGPFASMILADLGADVIKIEDVGAGDDTRHWGPPFHGNDAAYYHSVNRNKRSLAVDLKSEEGLALVLRVARSADVLLENFRPGTAGRLGLGYAALSAENPRLVYGSVSGHGHTGPLSRNAGYDAIAQAMSGAMSVTGEPDGEPVRFGVAGADLSAGLWATIGVLAALQSREQTGRGQHVDVALVDGLASLLTYVAQNWFASGETPRRYGSAHPNIVPYQGFPTSDGDIMVAVGNDSLWRRFAPVLGLDDLAVDPRFATNPDRVRNRDELLPLIEQALAARTTAQWTQALETAGIPVGPILTVPDALTHPQLLAREMVVDLPHPVEGTVRSLGSPVKLSGTPPQLRHASPAHGEHTGEILAAMGFGEQDIRRLLDGGVVKG
ncbi:MAG: CoA transferase [Actinomycetota bacterium]|nr:CoA transferase [Actinomycetota bacterium]